MLRQLLTRPIAVTMAVFVAIVLGLVSAIRLPVSLIPDVDVPYITVQVSEKSYSARELEEKVLQPLRQQLAQIDGLKDISSTAEDGRGAVLLSFDFGANIDYYFIEANEKVDRTMSLLPPISRPQVIKYSASDIPIFYLNISLKDGTESSFNDLSRFVRSVVVKRLEQLPSVSIADASGYDENQYLIEPYMDKMQSLGLSLEDLEGYLKSSDISLGNLSVRDREYRYNINFKSLVGSKEDLQNIYFKKGGRVFQLKDIAKVSYANAELSGGIYNRSNRIISIAVIKQADSKISGVRDETESLIESMSSDYPDIDFKITRNQSELLDYSIRSLLQNLLFALLATVLVIIIFFRNIRLSMLSALTIPVSVLLSMFCFRLFGISINILSLSGLLLGVGLMVDNSIILIDNINEHYHKSPSREDAIVRGTKEVAGVMLSSTLTTCAVFLPIVFIKGIAAALFSEQAEAVVITLLASYVVTVICVPVFYYNWFGKDKKSARSLTEKLPDINRFLIEKGAGIGAFFLNHRRIVFPILAICVAGLFLLYRVLPKTRLPHMDHTETILKLDWNEPLGLETSLERIMEMESNLPGNTEEFIIYAGHQQYMLGHTENMSENMAEIYIKGKSSQELEQIKSRISRYLSEKYKTAFYEYKESSNVLDFVFADKEAYLSAVFRPLRAGFSGGGIHKFENLLAMIDLSNDLTIPPLRFKPSLVLLPDHEKMALYGITGSELADVLKKNLVGSKMFDLSEGDEIMPVVIKTGSGNISVMLKEIFIVKGNARIPVRELLRETYSQDLRTVCGNIGGEIVPVELNVEAGHESEAIETVRDIVRDDGSFDVSFSGVWFSGRKLAWEMLAALSVAIVILYLILASQFESLKQPAIILSEVVIDFFFVFLFLWILGISLNVMTMIGLIVTSGIVINDSILKIDTINKLVLSGMDMDEAIVTAGHRRMKSIIMTSLTTVLAVLPFLDRGSLGDCLQYPMSVVIIVGMFVGTFVSLFVVPALYRTLYSKRQSTSDE